MGKMLPQRLSPAAPFTGLCKPELLAPAGDMACVRAAVENGADAVYFGLSRFNARLRAHNFTERDLPEVMGYLHERGVKGYVTFNTLVFPEELREAESFLRAIIGGGVDAAIVQDPGVCRLIRCLSPDFPIHASTQMSVTSEAGVAFARELGCSVVVLARECSLKEIAAIREKTAAAGIEVPLEIFVHGALCVAYSGQCLTSESLGGRSANRGECAQACRLPYELISDGRVVPLGDRRYLLSPQDLAGLEALPGIVRAGVATLKIEGRLKTPEYVAAVTGVYRRALDKAWSELHPDAPQPPDVVETDPEDELYQLSMTFSRGLSTGWLNGIDNQKLVHARFGKKRGVRLGTVLRVDERGIHVKAESPVKAGDGIVVDRGRPDETEEGGSVVGVDELPGGVTRLRFHGRSVDLGRVSSGDIVWKTADPAMERQLRQTFEGEQVRYRRPVGFQVGGSLGEPLRLVAVDEAGYEAEAVSAERLRLAGEGASLGREVLLKQLGRLGGSPFYLGELDDELPAGLALPVSQLNQVRREAVARLLEKRRMGRPWTLNESVTSVARVQAAELTDVGSAAELIPLVRSQEQLEAVLGEPCREIYIELEDPRRYAEAVRLVRESTPVGGEARRVWVAPPRMFKTGEDWIIKQLRECGADGFLARNHEHLRALGDQRLRGDFSLNVANPLTAEWFKERWGLERLTASYDLNNEQLAGLLRAAPPAWFEITIHQHMPMFHMEHCVFCAFLSTGRDFRDCGRPCDKHRVTLRDRVGAEHPLKADAGCRNTLFNARAQTGADYVESFIALGARHFRVEFLNESAADVKATLDRYRRLLAGELEGAALWRDLKLINQLGVTRGTLVEKR